MTPADRTDILAECNSRLAVLEEYAPKMMDEEEIKAVVSEVLAALGLDAPSFKRKRKDHERTDAESQRKSRRKISQ